MFWVMASHGYEATQGLRLQRWKCSWTILPLIRRPLPCPETPVADDPLTPRHVPEELKLVLGNRQLYFGAESPRFVTTNCTRQSFWGKGKGKAIHVHAWTGPDFSRKFRLVVSLYYPPAAFTTTKYSWYSFLL